MTVVMEQILQKGELVYRNDEARVRVYRGLYAGVPVAIKVQVHLTVDSANAVIHESMWALKVQHRRICKVLDCRIEANDEGFESLLVTEWMDGGDVMKEIKKRTASSNPWPGPQLRFHLYEITEALSLAEDESVIHRDIKPQNLLCNGEGTEIKIADFGSAKMHAFGSVMHTLQGSPFYLSPELKRYFMQRRGAMGQVQHDPYRSDVYSLGLTFLHMARLAEPKELMDLDSLNEVTEQIVGQLAYDEDIKWFLKSMLGVDNRPDFKELYQCMKNCYYPPPQEVAVPQAQPQSYIAVVEAPAQVQLPQYSPIVVVESLPQACIELPDLCLVCGKSNKNWKWRKYMPKKYLPKKDLFLLVCSPDCLDLHLKTIEEEAKKPEPQKTNPNISRNECGFCSNKIPDDHQGAQTLGCNHDICGWRCLTQTILNSKNDLQCQCRFKVSKKVTKKILSLCVFPTNTACLDCGEETDRSAKCKHPFCLECAEARGKKLTEKCFFCQNYT